MLLIRIRPMSGMRHDVFESETLARAAQTLATTLSDVLFSLFPRAGHAMAVVSPQASPAIAAALGADRPAVDGFAARAAPRLVERLGGGVDTAPIDSTEATRAITAWLAECEWVGAPPQTPDDAAMIDLLLIEDSRHDLGVVNALWAQEPWNNVLHVWDDYLGWLETREKGWAPPHAHGATDLPSFVDYRAAKAVTSMMLGSAAQQAAPTAGSSGPRARGPVR